MAMPAKVARCPQAARDGCRRWAWRSLRTSHV